MPLPAGKGVLGFQSFALPVNIKKSHLIVLTGMSTQSRFCKYRDYATAWRLDHAAVAIEKPAGCSVVQSFAFCPELKP